MLGSVTEQKVGFTVQGEPMARQKTAQSQSVRTTLSGVVREDVLAKLRVSFETYSILDAVDEVDGSHIRENARIKVRSHCCDCMAWRKG